jgi:hypothetical protein
MRLLRLVAPCEAVSSRCQRASGPNMVVPIEVFSSPMAVAQERSEMTAFTIQASKNGQTITTVRIRPTVCVEKAKTLLQEGWQVHITNAAGHQYGSDEFDQLAAELQSSEMANP